MGGSGSTWANHQRSVSMREEVSLMHELLAFTINHTNDFVNAKRHARARETSARRVGVSGLLTEKVDSTIH